MLHFKKEHFLPVFTEKRALFQHILRDAKSTKCELKSTFGKGLTAANHSHMTLPEFNSIQLLLGGGVPCLQAPAHGIMGVPLHVKIDNVTAVAHISKEGNIG